MNYLITQNDMFIKLIKWYFRIIGKNPGNMEMVKYWKERNSVEAKVTRAPDGSQVMYMQGEKYPLACYPRGYILFGKISKLKHEIKNQIFNESWAELEQGEFRHKIIENIKRKLATSITELSMQTKYDMLPVSALSPAVREIHRAWTKVSPHTSNLRDIMCFILQEDDAYRFRVQWLADWFGWLMKLNPIKSFDYALKMLEIGEVVGDMKERQRLVRRILMLALEDENIRKQFFALFREINWKKVKLTKGDRYYFRGKYFKVDLKYFDY